MVMKSHEKSWNLKMDFPGLEKSWNWENDQGHGKVMKLKFFVLIYTFLLHQNLEYLSFN